jgi:hypothetical protein
MLLLPIAGFTDKTEKRFQNFSETSSEWAFIYVGAALDESKKSKKRTSAIASRADLDQAIAALSLADERRLEKYASYKIRGLGWRARGQTHEDLLQEAMASIYEGTENAESGRHWRKDEVPFVPFVAGVMRSIASHWGDACDENEAQLEADLLIESDDGSLLSPLASAPSGIPPQDREASVKEELTAVLKLFADDDDAILIIEGWGIGMTGPEIVEQFGMPQQRYEAGVKRIRYQVKAR